MSYNRLNAIERKIAISRNNGKASNKGRRDDHTVCRILMVFMEFASPKHDFIRQGQYLQLMPLENPVEPLPRRKFQLQLSLTAFIGNLPQREGET